MRSKAPGKKRKKRAVKGFAPLKSGKKARPGKR